METRIWEIWFRTCEGDERWTTARCPDDWEAYDVEQRFCQSLGGVGGDPAEFISCEWYYGSQDDWTYDFVD